MAEDVAESLRILVQTFGKIRILEQSAGTVVLKVDKEEVTFTTNESGQVRTQAQIRFEQPVFRALRTYALSLMAGCHAGYVSTKRRQAALKRKFAPPQEVVEETPLFGKTAVRKSW